MKIVNKACACVLRQGEILAFRHPLAGNQLVKGTIEVGEDPLKAVLRELEEESGLIQTQAEWIAELEHLIQRPESLTEKQIWQLYILDAPANCLENWEHIAIGSPAEEGLTFSFYWQKLSGPFNDFHPVFLRVIEAVLNWQNLHKEQQEQQ